MKPIIKVFIVLMKSLRTPGDPRGCLGCRDHFYSAQIPSAWMIARGT